jgi:hypothetical protein
VIEMNQKRIKEVLGKWTVLLGFLKTCSEGDACALLEAEKEGACRQTTLMRIHQRYNVLRGRREREVLREMGMRVR